MNKLEIAAFFDGLAPEWDAHQRCDDKKIELILDSAGIRPGISVVDVACGTGVLFPYYLSREVASVTGVDLSPQMIRIAATKLHDPRVQALCGDIEQLPVISRCDCCVVYNAFPHFEDPARLICCLTHWIKPGGSLTVAHGMGIESLQRHHSGRAQSVSRDMLSAAELSALMNPYFDITAAVSTSELYIVSGRLR